MLEQVFSLLQTNDVHSYKKCLNCLTCCCIDEKSSLFPVVGY